MLKYATASFAAVLFKILIPTVRMSLQVFHRVANRVTLGSQLPCQIASHLHHALSLLERVQKVTPC